jgi:hypothetical protein
MTEIVVDTGAVETSRLIWTCVSVFRVHSGGRPSKERPDARQKAFAFSGD